MLIYTRNKAYRSDTITLTPNCRVINLTLSTIQCITYSNRYCREEGSIFLTYFSLPPLSPLSSCLQSSALSLSHLFFYEFLSTVSVALTLQITLIPLLQALSLLLFLPRVPPRTKELQKTSLFFSLHFMYP